MDSSAKENIEAGKNKSQNDGSMPGT